MRKLARASDFRLRFIGREHERKPRDGMGGYVSLLYCSLVALIIHPFRKSSEMQNSIARNTTTVKQQTVFQVSYSTVVPIIASNHYHNH